MESKFVKAVNKQLNYTLTENGQLAYKSTDYSAVLDFFAIAGALRTRTEREIEDKMRAAFDEDAHLAVKLMFYLGDVRGGLGERRTFRIALHWLAMNHPEWVEPNLFLIPEYTRWDNLFVLKDTPCENIMVDRVKRELEVGYQTAQIFSKETDKLNISLLAKWMPSINASPETRKLGLWFVKKFGYTEQQYRKMLSTVRAYLRVVETQMSAGAWDSINYSQVPSMAMSNYRKAFYTHDEKGFGEYIKQVKENKAVIHASTLYPYNIVEKIMGFDSEEEVLELQWKALPNYVGDKPVNIMVMADVSGSMEGRPLATSIGLAIYFAERNNGPYKNLFMTFSEVPEFVKLKGRTLQEKISNAANAHWNMNTDLYAAYKKILMTAIENNLSTEDLPKALIVISDMEIDSATYFSSRNPSAPHAWGQKRDFMAEVRALYRSHGYEPPTTIFWNVSSRKDTFLASGNDQGIVLVSGQSPSVFKNIVDAIDKTPYEAMLKYLNSDRYNCVRVPE